MLERIGIIKTLSVNFTIAFVVPGKHSGREKVFQDHSLQD